jgi:hypothetical protein
MKNKILILCLSLITFVFAGCSENNDGPTITPPSWKGFNYVVKRAVQGGQSGENEQIERAPLLPGDDIKVYAVRKNKGNKIGQISGTIYLRYTLYPEKGDVITGTLDKPVTSLANDSYDGWEEPYATFTLPYTDQPYEYFRVEVACQFYFKAFGNQNSLVDYSDQTYHEEPYIGSIFTDYANFHPMNGGSANSGKEAGGLKYHTIYIYRQ